MDKKQQLLDYLDHELFTPVLLSPFTSAQLKYDFRHTRDLLKDFSAEGILYYMWNTMVNSESKILFYNRLMDEGFNNYNSIVSSLQNEFTYEWLHS